ncbi:MAG TPA: 50S ribosomal protein L25/general stress protein Ctc [Casimicrobiaceae bacterium]|nr:50S ribosomal protein L25/general stress protein Ctc [Casimicrobiaceae bacterium]
MEFTAFPRHTEGRGASRRMRRAGKAPGIVYGGTVAPTPIELDHNALFHALRGEAFHSSILTMKLDGAATKVLLRDVQMHPFRNEILHVDFQRVDENKKIHMKVPLHFVKGEDSPAVKLSSAIISHVTTDLEITCLPKDLPGFIEVDLSTLEVGHAMHVSSVKLPAGVTVVTRGKTDPVVAAAIVPRAQVETEEETAAAEATAAATAAPEGEAKAAADDKGGDKKDAKKDDKKDDKKK